MHAINIKQESLVVEDKSSTLRVIDEGIGNLEVTPKLEFNAVGDYITYKLVLRNTDGKKYKIVSVTDNNPNQNIKMIYDYNTNMDKNNKTIKITLKYDSKVLTQTKLKSIKVTIKLIDEDNNKQNITINKSGNNTGSNTNPNTGSNIKVYP